MLYVSYYTACSIVIFRRHVCVAWSQVQSLLNDRGTNVNWNCSYCRIWTGLQKSSKGNVEFKINLFWVLFGTSTANLHKIQRVQNTLAKIVLNNSALPSTIALHQLHWLPVKQHIPFSQDHPHTSHHLLTLIIRPDLSVLPHSVCYMFLSPPRPSVTKPSGLQLVWFGTLFHKISCY